MIINVLFFAQAREHAGRARDTLELPDGSRVADALGLLQRDHPALAPLCPHLAAWRWTSGWCGVTPRSRTAPSWRCCRR